MTIKAVFLFVSLFQFSIPVPNGYSQRYLRLDNYLRLPFGLFLVLSVSLLPTGVLRYMNSNILIDLQNVRTRKNLRC